MSLTRIKSSSRAGFYRAAMLAVGCLLAVSCKAAEVSEPVGGTELGCGPQVCTEGADLRAAYAGAIETWPKAETTNDTPFEEMAALERPAATGPNLMAMLGEKLFFDPILSASGQIACASCHHPDLAFTDGIRVSVGHDRQQGKRNAPTLLDKADQPIFMWDGAAMSLEHQAMMPISNPIEMAESQAALIDTLNTDPNYVERFRQITGEGTIAMTDVTAALAAYERTLTRRTKFDLFLAGDRDRFTDQELFGLHLFRTKARCMTCHSGPRLTDDAFHNIGLTYYGRKYEDLGRYALTEAPDAVGEFKTPSLRHVRRTGPYMHNGLFPSLLGIVNLYNAGGARPWPRPGMEDDPLFPETSELLPKLNLTSDERNALVAYLETL
ncbi:cytochrome-c peroxidase [Hyphomonas sp.]|uniref:cytochrome-c peroxidase n=1 Tax=Hyphomonas sp. TaxID=87 RepID=UPI003529B942